MQAKHALKYVKQRQAAERLGIPYSTFRHAVARGDIAFYTLGNQKFFKVEEIDSAMQPHRTASTAE
jgi:excisionase family DNA binding protein